MRTGLPVSPWLERRLGPRLKAVALQVEGRVVGDIGSDHGYLPAYLLRAGWADKVIVVEKNSGPLALARHNLRRVNADVRGGDGLSPIAPGELDCLCMSGFGGALMESILLAHPERIPGRLVLQPNDNPILLRRWAQAHGFRVTAESLVESYLILTFQRLVVLGPS